MLLRHSAFGKPIAALYSVQEMVAEMHVKLEAARLLVDDVATYRHWGGTFLRKIVTFEGKCVDKII
ncbi:MAG: acyl-CoA dehydrogenase family protein [Faecalispora sporosphaeroides]|uniref:acyl-CoA dehydrogenase family protein n=1 Tax=Faecalispora sporosphaeroides TaxID=1549 RepID=UPI002DD9C609|nr:acyl-CoA dehydrogenase family protein [Faecalispora sporosphaeroides]